jgi:hypothetical protein
MTRHNRRRWRRWLPGVIEAVIEAVIDTLTGR